MKKIRINFDLDGCLVGLYDVPNWLECLENEDTFPYETAEPLLHFATLARMLNKLKAKGYEIAVITWLAKNATEEYNEEVTEVKLEWLAKHLPTVEWNEIIVVPYGTPKEMFCHTAEDVLFDDEEHNRNNWTGKAYDVENILAVLAEM